MVNSLTLSKKEKMYKVWDEQSLAGIKEIFGSLPLQFA